MSHPEQTHTVKPPFAAAMTGNGDTCATLDRSGSLDWLGGISPGGSPMGCDVRFALSPTEPAEAQCEMVGQTAVLHTTWRLGTGSASVTDFVPLVNGRRGDAREPSAPWARFIRLVEGLDGALELSFRLAPRPGGRRPQLSEDPHGLLFTGDDTTLVLQTSGEVRLDNDGTAHGTFSLQRGDTRVFVLTCHQGDDPEVKPLTQADTERALDRTFDHWLTWAQGIPFQGVQRSHLLHLLVPLRAVGNAPWGSLAPAGQPSAGPMFAAAALAAWGDEQALEQCLAAWRETQESGSEAAEEVAWLLDTLAEGERTGLIPAPLWLPHREHLSDAVDDLVEHTRQFTSELTPESRLARLAGLAGALALVEQGLLAPGTTDWEAALEEQGQQLLDSPSAPVGWADALALAGRFPGGSADGAAALDDPDRVPRSPRDDLWAIWRTLGGGAYTQARRAMDRFLLDFSPVWNADRCPGADPTSWARAAWLAARIYLQEPPTPGKIDLPEEWG
ncbi:MAG: hypothetical protein VKP62_12725 [Candidatus Sericytochromatia bacterium]|nr:hypothetical protein [Candidatus Sericytochromatia bacterium]